VDSNPVDSLLVLFFSFSGVFLSEGECFSSEFIPVGLLLSVVSSLLIEFLSHLSVMSDLFFSLFNKDSEVMSLLLSFNHFGVRVSVFFLSSDSLGDSFFGVFVSLLFSSLGISSVLNPFSVELFDLFGLFSVLFSSVSVLNSKVTSFISSG